MHKLYIEKITGGSKKDFVFGVVCEGKHEEKNGEGGGPRAVPGAVDEFKQFGSQKKGFFEIFDFFRGVS